MEATAHLLLCGKRVNGVYSTLYRVGRVNMNVQTHTEMASLIWRICNLLRGPYKRNEYRKVILPLTVLRRFDCVLAETRPDAPEQSAGPSGPRFYNESKLNFRRLLDDPNSIAANLNAYIEAYSPGVRQIMERFGFAEHVDRMAEKNLLFQVVQEFSRVDLSPARVDNTQMGYVFEELIRIGAEQSNEEAGEHFTPREVIRLMVSLLLSPEPDLSTSYVIKTIYDPACGTGGMLSTADAFLREHNSEARTHLIRPGPQRRVVGGVQVRHAHQGRERREHRARRRVHR